MLLFSFFYFLSSFDDTLELLVPMSEEVLILLMFKVAMQDPMTMLMLWNEVDASPCHWVHIRYDAEIKRIPRLALEALSLSNPLQI